MKASHLAFVLLICSTFMIVVITPFTVGITYDLSVTDDDGFIWEVDTCDQNKYETYFGEEPNFKEGTKKKVDFREITEKSDYWSIDYDKWDYTLNEDTFLEDPDENKEIKIYKNPSDQANRTYVIEDIIEMWVIATPVDNYLSVYRDNFENAIINVYVEGLTLEAKYAFSNIEYEISLTYTFNGVIENIQYIEEDGTVFVDINLHRDMVSSYPIPIILMIISITSIVIILKKRNTPPITDR